MHIELQMLLLINEKEQSITFVYSFNKSKSISMAYKMCLNYHNSLKSRNGDEDKNSIWFDFEYEIFHFYNANRFYDGFYKAGKKILLLKIRFQKAGPKMGVLNKTRKLYVSDLNKNLLRLYMKIRCQIRSPLDVLIDTSSLKNHSKNVRTDKLFGDV